MHINRIQNRGSVAAILQRQTPEPSGLRLGENQRQRDQNVPPFAAERHASFIASHDRVFPRSKQANGLDLIVMVAKVNIGEAALDLVTEEQIYQNAMMTHPPDRAVGVHLRRQSRSAFEMVGAAHRGRV